MIWNEYEEVLEEIKHPNNPHSKRRVICTEQQAKEHIGKPFLDNPAWRYKEMRFIKQSHITK